MNIGNLQRMTVTKVREVGLEIGRFTGVHGMSKEEVIQAIKELIAAEGPITLPSGQQIEPGGEIQAGPKPAKVKKVIDKAAAKAKIKSLKQARDSAIDSQDEVTVMRARQKIKRLKRQLRRVS